MIEKLTDNIYVVDISDRQDIPHSKYYEVDVVITSESITDREKNGNVLTVIEAYGKKRDYWVFMPSNLKTFCMVIKILVHNDYKVLIGFECRHCLLILLTSINR